MSLRIGGLGSGMDTQMMLEQLMRAERMPLDRLKQQKQVLQWKQEDYRTINTKLLNFRNLSFDMRLSNKYTARSATSSNSSVVTATATGSAASGSYTVEVEKLATRSFANSVSQLNMAEGKNANNFLTQAFTREIIEEGQVVGTEPVDFEDFILNGVHFTFDQSVAAEENFDGVFINPSSSTLNSLISGINNSKAGVHVFYDKTDNKIFISSKEAGQPISIQAADSDKSVQDTFISAHLNIDLNDSENYRPGEKAEVTVNGYKLTRDSNSFSFGGVNFNINEIGSSTITVARNTDQVFNNVKEFVDQYNSLIGAINEKLFEPRSREYQPLTDEQKEQLSDREAEKWEEIARQGHLRNDTMLQGVLSNLRSIVGGAIDGLDVKMLSQIGISTGSYQERGVLHIDENKLRAAINENPDTIHKIFAGDSSKGIEGLSAKLTKSLDNAMTRIGNQAGRSSNIVDQSFIGKSIKDLEDRIFAFEDRLQRVEDRYWKQFTAMEKAMEQMYSQSQWLSQQLMMF